MNRRSFLRSSATVPATLRASWPLATWGALHGLSRQASAQGGGEPPPYRALVCLFLAGGNDSYNLLVPRPQSDYASNWGGVNSCGTEGELEWQEYCKLRGELNLGKLPWTGDPDAALDKRVLPLNGTSSLHPQALNGRMHHLQAIFNDSSHNGLNPDGRHAAFLTNVGPLVEPVTAAQVRQRQKLLPLHLRSHSDQITQWQTCFPQGPSSTGWIGRLADELGVPGTSAGSTLTKFSLISMDGIQTALIGGLHQPFVDTGSSYFGPRMGGSAYLEYTQRRDKLNSMLTAQTASQHLLTRAYAQTVKESLDSGQSYHSIVGEGARSPVLADNTLNTRHGMVAKVRRLARIIEQFSTSSNPLAPRRQIFFLTFGGWDQHNGLATAHADNLGILDSMLGEFYAQMQQLGLLNAVTLFTASDFGRALRPNGDGTDHAWGGNQIVMGGAVNGGQIYGQYPKMKLMAGTSSADVANANADADNLDIVGNGTLMPTLSVDQYMQRLGRWFLTDVNTGSWTINDVDDPKWLGVLPNWGELKANNAGFLNGFMGI